MFIYIKLNDKYKQNNIKTLQQIYADFIADANFLKEATKDKINIYKTKSYKKTTLQFFCNLNLTIQSEPIK
jgi:hypothetical protein